MKPFIYPSSMETARALILHLIKIMIDEPGKTFNFAFSGGSTPALMFDLWANEYSDITPWTRMRVYFVDERCVPPENSDSNYGMMRSLLVGVVPIPYENVFRIKGEERPEKEAVRYSRMVENNVAMKDGWPVFDKIYEVSYNPNNGQKRIAMTGCPIINAQRVIFLITGKSKADVVEEMCTSGDTGPAAYIAHHAENVELFLDDYAASKIDEEEISD